MKINNTPTPDAIKAYNSQSLQGVQHHTDKNANDAQKTNHALLADKVNISNTSKLMQDIVKAVSDSPDIRLDKVKEVQSKIENNSYKPDLKAVADKLLSPSISDRI